MTISSNDTLNTLFNKYGNQANIMYIGMIDWNDARSLNGNTTYVFGGKYQLQGISARALGYYNGTMSDNIWRQEFSYDSLRSSFQAGVDKIYNSCVRAGSTPASSSPDGIENAINKMITPYLRYDFCCTIGYNQSWTSTKRWTADENCCVVAFGNIGYSCKIDGNAHAGNANWAHGSTAYIHFIQMNKGQTIEISGSGGSGQGAAVWKICQIR